MQNLNLFQGQKEEKNVNTRCSEEVDDEGSGSDKLDDDVSGSDKLDDDGSGSDECTLLLLPFMLPLDL